MTDSTGCRRRIVSVAPLILGLIGCLAAVSTLDVADDVWWSADGPGLTFDEGLNVEGGVYLAEALLRSGLAALHPATWWDIFNSPAYAHDYPPLGRLALGISNAAVRAYGAKDRGLYVITCARVSSAVAYGMLIALMARFSQKRFGNWAGLASAASLLLTPRLFAHAQIASIETIMNLTYAASVLGLIQCCAGRDCLRVRDVILPGALLGLAFLTKIQAVFLPPVVAVWLLWNWRLRGVVPLIALGLTALATFYLGWPWLWSDPIGRGLAYFAQSTDRAVLYCYYLGERYADRDVPWHYPFVMFAVTTPAIWLALGFFGIFARHNNTSSPESDRREFQILIGAFLLPLIVFAIPGVAVYDGERLFLVVWPIFAVFVGRGAQQVVNWFDRDQRNGNPRTSHQHLAISSQASATRSMQKTPTRPSSTWARRSFLAAVTVLLALPLFSTVTLHPCQLSYYNELIGGLRGAAALGFEPTYWGDSATPTFLKRASQELSQGTRLAVSPVLHPFVLDFLRESSWLRHRPDLKLEAYDDTQPNVPRHVLVIRRRADAWPSLSPPPAGTKVLASLSRSEVPLAELLELPQGDHKY